MPRDMPVDTAGDFPAVISAQVERAFGATASAQMQALACRAPLDLRTNTLRATRDQCSRLSPNTHRNHPPCPLLASAITPSETTARLPNIEATDAFTRGWIEVQDEGSQIAALLSGARPAMAVADLCAGAGGKTLAMAALMENRGTLNAYDADRARLRPIAERLKRAGVHNTVVLEAGDAAAVAQLAGRMDAVLVDAPCTGSGVWRRHPDAKWRLTMAEIEQRCLQQREVLAMAAPLVQPRGRNLRATCSVLPIENSDQVTTFLAGHPEFAIVPAARAWAEAIPSRAVPASADGRTDTLQLTPRDHDTDGFFIAVLERLR